MATVFDYDIPHLFTYLESALKCDLIKITAGKDLIYVRTSNVNVVHLNEDRDVLTFIFANGARLIVYRAGLVEYRAQETKKEPETKKAKRGEK